MVVVPGGVCVVTTHVYCTLYCAGICPFGNDRDIRKSSERTFEDYVCKSSTHTVDAYLRMSQLFFVLFYSCFSLLDYTMQDPI